MAPNEAIALATVWLAGVTTLLAIYTYRLWSVSKNAEAPFLFPHIIGCLNFFGNVDPDDPRPTFVYTFENQGKTPGVVRRWRDYTLFTDQLPARPDFSRLEWSERHERHIPIAAGQRGGNVTAAAREGITSEEIVGRLNRRAASFYVIGEVEYEDIFNEIRIQGFCLQILRLWQQPVDGVTQVLFQTQRDGGQQYNYRRKRDL